MPACSAMVRAFQVLGPALVEQRLGDGEHLLAHFFLVQRHALSCACRPAGPDAFHLAEFTISGIL
ncbi:hypothetical protein ACVOMV_23515 [Mesorhizobium atlanticum]